MSILKNTIILLGLVMGVLVSFSSSAKELSDTKIARGQYLIEIGGCNDCHTAGYAATGGNVAKAQWLMGDKLGYSGPWGTTYPVNLREYFGKISEGEWVKFAKTFKARPPMPYWALNAMSKRDLQSVYEFVRSLGVAKNTVPSYLPPGSEIKTAFIQWPMPPK